LRVKIKIISIKMKTLSILGSTGSIGTQTLDIVRGNPGKFKIIGLTSNKNIELLRKQIDEFRPEAVAVMDKEKADLLKKAVNINVYSGIDGIIKISKLNKADTVINSLVGSIGVKPTIEAIKNKKNIALANKETLVTAGSVVMDEVEKNNVDLMPIDSEHSAIFQCLNSNNIKKIINNNELKNVVNKIIITCSGGAFKSLAKEQLENVTAADALKHPTWNMGNKITIDSATLMNKGFEVIEAHWLYDMPYEKINVLMHPQSIIHSLVEFKDNSVIAQLGNPDMKLPIQYALSYPERLELKAKRLDLAQIKSLSFENPDLDKSPCLKYAYDAGKTGGTLPAVLNAANEIAVYAFLDGKIKFLDIPKLVNKMMKQHKTIKNPSLNEILDVDEKVKEHTKKIIESKSY
jgi:1-deoxy-D-xylulose-5-phosphate reductoisomerase